MVFRGIYYGTLWYILMYNAIRVTPREGPQLEAAFKVLVSRPKAIAQAMPEDGRDEALGSLEYELYHPVSCSHFESESLG